MKRTVAKIISAQFQPDNQLPRELAKKKRFFLLIGEERVGPFVRIGNNEHLSEILLERGIGIEVEGIAKVSGHP